VYIEALTAFEATYNAGEVGLVPALEVAIQDNDGVVVYGPTAVGIAELLVAGQPTGDYSAELTAPATPGQYSIIFSNDGSFDPDAGSAIDDLVVVAVGTTVTFPPIPGPEADGLVKGPCTAWIDGEDVAACCSVESSSGVLFEDVATTAYELLFELSGRQFVGSCEQTVRPCRDNCSCFPAQRLAYASGGSRLLWTGAYWGYNGSAHCGCGCLSQVKLSGYPVQSITEVKIDGVVVEPSEYRLDEKRYLTRMNDTFWPSCQDLSLPDSEEGTFSVSYVHGANPPQIAVSAAAQLACELYKECVGEVCAMPRGATRITRQGIVIEKLAFTNWAFRERTWRTGMPLVDAFLSAYNSAGIMRRPVFWAPGRRYARPLG
jgi:hypothetical protein